jgi:hypothetical protein
LFHRYPKNLLVISVFLEGFQALNFFKKITYFPLVLQVLADQEKPTPAWCSSANSLTLQVKLGMVAGQVWFSSR